MVKKDPIPKGIDSTPVSNVWSLELPPDFSEPADRYPYIPYEPTPIINRTMNPMFKQVEAHQQAVSKSLAPLFDEHAPDSVPADVQSMILLDRLTGDVRRTSKNLYSFSGWGDTTIDALLKERSVDRKEMAYEEIEQIRAEVIEKELANDGLRAICDKLLLGTVTPFETLELLRQTSLASAEVAKVTHPYGYRLHYVADARTAIDQAIRDHDGIAVPRILSTYQKIQLQPHFKHHDEHGKFMSLTGFLATYKRPLGHVTRADGRRVSIIERQSAALRIDEDSQHIPKDIALTLRRPFEAGDDWRVPMQRFDKKTSYQSFFETAIHNDADADFLVPLSTMFYAAAETEAEYAARREYEEMMSARKIAKATLNNKDTMLFIDSLDE